jgi:bifunctional UDP-N-acetylglucosamine pyrophosphorylase/glucosamine-1-phosphate N-acetyltransferase
MTSTSLASMILAGGKGTRMKSAVPKLLHTACGRTLIDWSLDAVAAAAPDRVVVIVPALDSQVTAALPGWAKAAVQERPLGTGDAVRSGRPALSGFEGDLLVVNADSPLTDPNSLRDLVAAHRSSAAAASVLTFLRTDAIGADFGRIVRGPDGGLARIVEVRDASAEERTIEEVSSGVFVFRSELLWPALDRLDPANDQGELYLTDVIAMLHADGRPVAAHMHPDASVGLGVNSRADLAEAAALLRARICRRHMLAGVTIVDPATTYVDAGVSIGQDAVIHPFTVLRGSTTVGARSELGPHVVALDAEIGEAVFVGPFCSLRPGTVLEAGSKAGTFVELKESRVGEGAKVPHLSYMGDAEIGAGTNIGAGSITANYDGRAKHATIIGRDVHTSCDTIFVAPVSIGDGAWTAAGSVITDDVPPDALGVARARQKNIEGYGKRRS